MTHEPRFDVQPSAAPAVSGNHTITHLTATVADDRIVPAAGSERTRVWTLVALLASVIAISLVMGIARASDFAAGSGTSAGQAIVQGEDSAASAPDEVGAANVDAVLAFAALSVALVVLATFGRATLVNVVTDYSDEVTTGVDEVNAAKIASAQRVNDLTVELAATQAQAASLPTDTIILIGAQVEHFWLEHDRRAIEHPELRGIYRSPEDQLKAIDRSANELFGVLNGIPSEDEIKQILDRLVSEGDAPNAGPAL